MMSSTHHQLHSTAPAWECTRLTVSAARPSLAARASTRRLPPRARPRDERPRDSKALLRSQRHKCNSAECAAPSAWLSCRPAAASSIRRRPPRAPAKLCTLSLPWAASASLSIRGSSRIRRLARFVCLFPEPRPRRVQHLLLFALLPARAVQNVPVLAQVEPQPRGQRRRLARGTGRHWRCPFVSRLRASAAARRQPGEYGGHGVWRRWWRRRLSGADERAGGVVVWPWPVLCKAELESLVAPRSSQLECGARIARSPLVRGLRIGSLHGALSLSLGPGSFGAAPARALPCCHTGLGRRVSRARAARAARSRHARL